MSSPRSTRSSASALSTASSCSRRIANVSWCVPVSRRPFCSSVTAVFTSSGVHRIHSRDEPMTTFSKPLSMRRWRTSPSRKTVPSSRSAGASTCRVYGCCICPCDCLMRTLTSAWVVCPTLIRPTYVTGGSFGVQA